MEVQAAPYGLISFVREALAIAWRFRRGLAIAFLIPLDLAVIAAALLPSQYTATASILVKNGPDFIAKEQGQVNGQAAPQVTKQEVVNSEIEMMDDVQTITETITALGGVEKVYPSIIKHPPSNGSVMDAAVDKFTKKLKVEVVKMSNIIDLSFQYPDQAMATKALATLLDVYQARHTQVYGGDRNTSIYEHDLKTELGDLERLEKQLTDLKMSNGIFDIDQQRQSLIAQRAASQDQLRQSLQQRATLTGRLSYLTSVDQGLPAMERSTETDKLDGIGQLTGTLVDLHRAESEELARYGAGHPLVTQTRDQIKTVESQIQAAQKDFTHVKTDPNPLSQQVRQEMVLDRTELAPLDATIAMLTGDVAHMTTELQRLESADMQQRVLVSRIASINENLIYLRTEYAKARASDDLDQQQAQSVIVSQSSMTSGKPTFPSMLLFTAVGIVLGGIVTGGILVLKLLTNDDVMTVGALEKSAEVRVLAVLPARKLVGYGPRAFFSRALAVSHGPGIGIGKLWNAATRVRRPAAS